MTSLQEKRSEIIPCSGYTTAFYGHKESIIFVNDNFIRFTTSREGRCSLENREVGFVTASTVTPDHSVLLFAVEEEGNAKIVGMATDGFTEQFALNVRNKVDCMVASSGSEIFACLSILEDRIVLSTFRVNDGGNDCIGNIIPETVIGRWEISFCPADEGVLCALGSNSAYLVRCSGGNIDTFSTIQFDNVLCHGWSNDVTICFGTNSGELRLYRETIALETVDLKDAAKSVLDKSSFNEITFISSSSRWFGVLFSQGLVLLFSNTMNGPIWEDCKAIIMTSFDPNGESILSFDQNDDYVLYSDGNILSRACIKYIDSVAKNPGLTVFGRHSSSVYHVKITNYHVFSMDTAGNFIVTSRMTGNFLTTDTVRDVVHFTVCDEFNVTLVKKNGIEKRIITVEGFLAVEASSIKDITLCCSTADSNMIAILQEKTLTVFRTEDNSIILEEKMKLKREIRKMLFSNDSKFLIILGENDQVFALDMENGKTIWNIEYKLKYFTDVCYANNIVYLLDNKFIVTRVKHGKEMSSLNMHAPDVGFNCSSQLITGNDHMLVCATDTGEIIVLELATPDQPYVLKQGRAGCASCLILTENILTIGYENGSVILVDFNEEHLEERESIDLILCDHTTYTNLSEIVRELDFERNSIREETERVMKEYKEDKENELARTTSNYEEKVKALVSKVQILEENYKISEEERKKTIDHLQKLYKDEAEATEIKYERILNEQIRKTLKMEEKLELKDRQHQREMEEQSLELKQSFHNTELSLIKESERLQIEIDKLNDYIRQMKKKLNEAENGQERAAMEFKKQMEAFQIKRKEDVIQLEKEIWNLKAVAVQVSEERDRYINDVSLERINLNTAKQQITNLKGTIDGLQSAIDQLKTRIKENERSQVEERRKSNKIHQKLLSTSQELEVFQRKAHKATRRCGELEARIERVADCVYDPRKLEHAVLGLIAFMQNIDADEQFKLT